MKHNHSKEAVSKYGDRLFTFHGNPTGIDKEDFYKLLLNNKYPSYVFPDGQILYVIQTDTIIFNIELNNIKLLSIEETEPGIVLTEFTYLVKAISAIIKTQVTQLTMPTQGQTPED